MSQCNYCKTNKVILLVRKEQMKYQRHYKEHQQQLHRRHHHYRQQNKRNRLNTLNQQHVLYQHRKPCNLLTLLSITLLLSQFQPIHAARRSPTFIVTDPQKESLTLERDIFKISTAPSTVPTFKPSYSPSMYPTKTASLSPSAHPTLSPSEYPSLVPSQNPSLSPSFNPSQNPTLTPSIDPSHSPSVTPSIEPSKSPTINPSLTPSLEPSLKPSFKPSLEHSLKPSFKPSNAPSNNPSGSPSSIPSLSPVTSSPAAVYPLGDTPNITDPISRSYFNYNPFDEMYGPGQLFQTLYYYNETISETTAAMKEKIGTTNINTTTTHSTFEPGTKTILKSMEYNDYQGNTWDTVRDSLEYQYWNKFEMGRTLSNRCALSPTRTQSPIDLCETHVNMECLEHHQIRNRAGDFNLNDTELQLKILPSKLRIEYSRVNSDLIQEIGLIPPHADFPLNWNGYISAVHIDIKIPSEHTFCGKRYAGEYQIYFYHPKRKQPIVQSILIEIHPTGRKHKHFQKALNEWQALFELKQLECLNHKRNLKADEERFLRRVRNYLRASVDSDEFSLIEDETHDGMPKGFDRLGEDIQGYDDKKRDEDDLQATLSKARHRIANPRFEEEYDGILKEEDDKDLPIHSVQTTTQMEDETNILTSECDKDSKDTFVLGDLNRTCCDLIHPDLQWGCKQDRLLQNCPNTCASLASSLPNQKNEDTDSPSESEPQSPSSSPSNKPRPRWNPFFPRIVNSIHFYGYGGSLTEPPCSEWVAWRVLDKPMQISYLQWDQMRNILFNQVDETCRRTSVHWGGSVARPIQSLNQRALWKCTTNDYVSDVDKRLQDEDEDDE